MLTVGYASKQKNSYDLWFYKGTGGRIAERVWESFSRDDCLMVYADGHELDVIKEQFSNLPMTKTRYAFWSGDFATFIIDNLKL